MRYEARFLCIYCLRNWNFIFFFSFPPSPPLPLSTFIELWIHGCNPILLRSFPFLSFPILSHSSALQFTLLYSTLLYPTLPHSTLLYSTPLFYTYKNKNKSKDGVLHCLSLPPAPGPLSPSLCPSLSISFHPSAGNVCLTSPPGLQPSNPQSVISLPTSHLPNQLVSSHFVSSTSLALALS